MEGGPPEGLKVLLDGMAGLFVRDGTGGGVFLGAIAAWNLELSLSLNLSMVL